MVALSDQCLRELLSGGFPLLPTQTRFIVS